ncbi:MAG: hypothetical protein CM15mP46_2470 [Alphaproteobacteria bacterium]|nr:MAG: hypothetical protein CM15mP46_2470 [Alphaproteobacteria bacterium]
MLRDYLILTHADRLAVHLYRRMYHSGTGWIDKYCGPPVWRGRHSGFGASLLVIGQILTVIMAVGLLVGNDYPLVQMLIVTTAVCFGYGFSNPALSAAASNAAGKPTMGGCAWYGAGIWLAWSGGGAWYWPARYTI